MGKRVPRPLVCPDTPTAAAPTRHHSSAAARSPRSPVASSTQAMCRYPGGGQSSCPPLGAREVQQCGVQRLRGGVGDREHPEVLGEHLLRGPQPPAALADLLELAGPEPELGGAHKPHAAGRRLGPHLVLITDFVEQVEPLPCERVGGGLGGRPLSGTPERCGRTALGP
eukprot:TRINITY_DN16960_c0_g1_i2.p3 TRINITY_DN16960_c0_g1~~TRINITY_DN16960_c0_g1_i2.p3  ORF type:complete len:169 (-),score=10.31 TRINITY_DN16960_c0_g1_i2:207-713(-)